MKCVLILGNLLPAGSAANAAGTGYAPRSPVPAIHTPRRAHGGIVQCASAERIREIAEAAARKGAYTAEVVFTDLAQSCRTHDEYRSRMKQSAGIAPVQFTVVNRPPHISRAACCFCRRAPQTPGGYCIWPSDAIRYFSEKQ